MAVFSSQFNWSLKAYLGRRKYERLDGAVIRKPKIKVARFGGNNRRVWRVKPIRKLLFKFWSPIKILRRLRDAYVDAMVRLAGTGGALNGGDVFGNRRVPKGRRDITISRKKAKEFQERMLIEIFKSIAASKDLTTLPP